MKSVKKISILSLASIMALVSCTMEKRVYMSGYHIETFDKKQNVKADANVKERTNEIVMSKQAPQLTDTIEDNSSQNETDDIMLASSDPNTIFIPSNNFVVSGKKEKAIKNNTTLIETPIIKEATKKANETPTDEPKKEDKSKMVAIVLCLLLGVVGAHRFYLGYTKIAILQILTLGGCGLWALIDLISIITGKLKPMDGEYEEDK